MRTQPGEALDCGKTEGKAREDTLLPCAQSSGQDRYLHRLLDVLGIGAFLTVAKLQDGMPASFAKTPISMTKIFFPAHAAIFPTSLFASAIKSPRHSSTSTFMPYIGELQNPTHRHRRCEGQAHQ